MKKQVLLYILAIALVIGVLALLVSRGNEKTNDGTLVLYYSDTCSHCKNVEKFIADNRVVDKLTNLQQKESSTNADNFNEMLTKANKCGIPRDEVAYPLLWTGSDCLIGDVDIINFFSQKIK